MTHPAKSSGAVAAPVPAPVPVLAVDRLGISVRTPAGLQPLVEELSFSLGRGETLCIAGESGSGKSLTALAIMGLLPPPAVRLTAGRVLLGDIDLAALPEARMRPLRGSRVAMIFQEPMTSLNPVMTVGTQLVEAIRAHDPVSRRTARARALDALRAVRLSQPEQRLGQYPHELSGGMRQRVMIAMALALKPEILIADEPTTALDVTVQREILDLLRDLQAETGTAIILITHDMGVVAEMADRVVVMQAGRMVETAPVAELFTAPRHAHTRALLSAVPRLGAATVPEATPPTGPPVVSVENLAVRFPLRGGVLGRVTHRVHAVEGVSFEIGRGETLALVGESGCGKSTVARALVGLVPHEGRIAVDGKPLRLGDAAGLKALRRSVQLVFQDPKAALDPRMTVGALIAEPLAIHGIGSPRDHRNRAAQLMERVGLDAGGLDRYPHEFSGGQRQRICIARALAPAPSLIIADESLSALDVSVQARVLDLLSDLRADLGLSFLFISHDIAVVERFADRVAVMFLGQIVEAGTVRQVLRAPAHAYTKRLIAAVPVPDPAHVRPPAPRLAGEVPSPVHPVAAPPARHVLRDLGHGHFCADP